MRTVKKTAAVLFGAFILFLLLDSLYPLDMKRLDRPKSTEIFDKKGNRLRITLSEDGFLRMALPQGAVRKDVVDALLAYEDRYFYYHPGFNPVSIIKALWFNMHHDRRIGASTITMQLARMMHKKPRTVKNKLVELFMSLQLEYHCSKDEILRYYLENAPYGGNIEGFASAAYAYFGRSIDGLSQAQIAYLSSIPKNPNRNRPDSGGSRVEFLKKKVLERLYETDRIDYERYLRAVEEKLNPKRHFLPMYAPHFCRLFGRGTFKTTLDLDLQQKIEKIVSDRVESLNRFNIHNASVVVIDNRRMEILAYIGSQNFNDKRFQGEVDGVKARISPGSTLKPFVYALALDRGLITPLKKLYDVPLNLSGYSPKNYSKSYFGEVTAADALRFSLNIPAVELDRLLGERSLYDLLRSAGIRSIDKNKEYYGRSIVLGGCGIKLKELAELFSALANGGIYRRSVYNGERKRDGKRVRIVTAESAYLISRILMNAPRTYYASSWEFIKDIPAVAFKTGTSAYAKDLLSIGYTPEYTVAVWLGNFDRSKSLKRSSGKKKGKRLSGLEAASPILFSIFRLLKPREGFKRPEGIERRKICQDAIRLGPCRSFVTDDTIRGKKALAPCKILRPEILTRMIYRGTIGKFGDLALHRCYKIWHEYKPHISSPVRNRKYTSNRLLPPLLKKTLMRCYSFENNSSIYWFIDGNLTLGGVSGEAIYHYFPPGRHTVECLDGLSRIDSVSFVTEEL